MTILQLISTEGFYGAESMLLSLSTALSRAGCRVIVAAFHDARFPHTEVILRAREADLPVRAIACNGRWDSGVVGRIREILSDCQVDVLHTHGYKADFYGFAATAWNRCVRVTTCHNWPDPRPLMQAYATLDRLIVRRFDAVTTPSPEVAAVLKRSGVRVEKLSFIPNGVDMDAFQGGHPVLRAEIRPNSKIVGYVGRLVHEKGGEVLLRAAKRVLESQPDVTFVFVGEGPCRDEWSAVAEQLGIAARVRFVGARNDMPSVFASLDAMVLPSFREAMPMCLLEAMAAGVPVIATSVGAVPSIVEENVTGCLVEPRDAAALAAQIQRVLVDREFANRVAIAGQAAVVRNYSSVAMARKYRQVYKNALSSRCHTVTVRTAER